MVQPVYEWFKGSTFSLALDVLEGTVVGTEPVAATLKAPLANGKPPGHSAPVLVTFTVNYVAAVGDVPAYWVFTGSESDSDALTSGDYVADAVIDLAGGTYRTPPVYVKVRDGVT